jgi:hypothetical protein
MSGTNQITFTDKVNTRTLPIPSQNKVRDVDLNEIKQEHNALDNIVTDPETGLVKVVEDLGTNKLDASVLVTDFSDPNNEDVPSTKAVDDYLIATFPENNETQLANVEGLGATIIQLGLNPLGIVVNFQIPEDEFGTLAQPLTDITFDFTLARRNKVYAYVEKTTLPTRLDTSANDDILWIGDAFSTTVGTVNKLEIKYQPAPSPQNRILEITNKTVDMSTFGVDPSLLAFYKFEEGVSDYDFIFDQTGYNHDGEISTTGTATRVAGSIGNAAQMSASGARFIVPHTPEMELTNQMTFACYVSMAAASFGSRLGIASKDADSDGAGAAGGWYITRETSGIFRFNVNGNSSYQSDSAYNYSTGDLVIHLAVTYNAGVLKIYVEKVLNSTDTNADLAFINGNQPLFIGGVQRSGFVNANLRSGGKIDEARYYNRALSDAEIAALP